ncbi:hypothetical protein BSF41_35310 [Flavobacterium sp. ACN2]|nr:hypothetical protein BSF41_35310 [Flavobacterium sp. ACN2]
MKFNINKKQDNEQQLPCNLNTLLSNNMIEKNIKNKINYFTLKNTLLCNIH